MAQWKEDRRCRALHEASHAVVARKLGLAVLHVTIRKRRAHALHTSAAYLAGLDDAKGRIEALEKDAIVAQAGYTADVYEYRHPVGAPDLFDVEDEDTDTSSTRRAIYKIVCLQTSRPFNEGGGSTIKIERDVHLAMSEVYNRIIEKAYVLVSQNWPAILRVAKHLERHGDIKDQAMLDRLI